MIQTRQSCVFIREGGGSVSVHQAAAAAFAICSRKNTAQHRRSAPVVREIIQTTFRTVQVLCRYFRFFVFVVLFSAFLRASEDCCHDNKWLCKGCRL